MRCFFVLLLLLAAHFTHAQTYKVGDKVDMYSTDGNYYAASVTEVSGSQYKIRFDAYAASNDTWVQGASLVRGGRPGDKIIVVSDKGTFYGVIKEVQNTKYKVKYDGYPDIYELTRSQFHFVNASTTAPPVQNNQPQNNQPQNSQAKTSQSQNTQSQNAQPQTTTAGTANTATNGFGIGAKVQALQRTTWYEATIKDFKNGKYLVKYDNYNEEEWLPKENLRAKPTLPADKLRVTTGKTYVRSIRWIATGNTELSWFFMGDNGVIVVNPVHGVNPVNFALEQVDNFKNVGYYTIANNTINIKWLNGNSTSMALTYKNGDISEMDAGGIMVRQKGLPDNYRLNGTYTGSISFGNVGSSSTYTFTKDGRISRSRTGLVSTADASGRATNANTGTYLIKGNTLFVTYADGTKETANIGVLSSSPGKLILNGIWMTAQ